MSKMSFVSILLVVVLVTACGGNDGKGKPEGPAAATCKSVEGGVFIDHVCSPWQNVSAYEQLNQSPWSNHEITNGRDGDAVKFSIIKSSDTGHHEVLDIKYASESDYSAVVRMRAFADTSVGLDMSEYATGKIQFDIKLIAAGDQSPDLEFVIECGYPCASTPKIIKPTALNQWQTFEYSINDLIERGLDIEYVTLGFMLSPAWGKQAGVHFQVDNIRWVKGEPSTPVQEICFDNYFDSAWVQGVSGPGVMLQGTDFIIPNDQLLYLTQGVNPYVKAVPYWFQMQGKWRYSFSEAISYVNGNFLRPSLLSACSSEGVLSLDIYVSENLVNDGTMSFTIHFVDADNNFYELPGSLISLADLTPGDWNRVSVNLSEETYHENLKYVGLSIDSTDVDDDLSGYFYVDNILIKHNVTN